MKNLFSIISKHSFILTAAHSVLKHEPLKKKDITFIHQPIKFDVMGETAQPNGKSMGFRDLGLNPDYITYYVVWGKFFNFSVFQHPQL